MMAKSSAEKDLRRIYTAESIITMAVDLLFRLAQTFQQVSKIDNGDMNGRAACIQFRLKKDDCRIGVLDIYPHDSDHSNIVAFLRVRSSRVGVAQRGSEYLENTLRYLLAIRTVWIDKKTMYFVATVPNHRFKPDAQPEQ